MKKDVQIAEAIIMYVAIFCMVYLFLFGMNKLALAFLIASILVLYTEPVLNWIKNLPQEWKNTSNEA